MPIKIYQYLLWRCWIAVRDRLLESIGILSPSKALWIPYEGNRESWLLLEQEGEEDYTEGT